MPNYCDARIVFRGYKDNVDEFRRILDADYNYITKEFSKQKHFYRIFDVWDIWCEQKGVLKTMEVEVECAWSIYCCMMDGPFSYYRDCIPEDADLNDENIKLHLEHSTNIMLEAERLKLEIEIVSAEPGVGFQEHYYIHDSELLLNTETKYHEYYIGDYDTKEEYERETAEEIPLSADDYLYYKENNEDIYIPYLVEIDENSKINSNKNMVNKIMCKIVKK
jgi:hypothetical protein